MLTWRNRLALASALAVGRLNMAGSNMAGSNMAGSNMAGSNMAGFIAALLLVQLTVVVIGSMRGARLFAMVELARCERG